MTKEEMRKKLFVDKYVISLKDPLFSHENSFVMTDTLTGDLIQDFLKVIRDVPKDAMIHIINSVTIINVKQSTEILEKLGRHPAGYKVYINDQCYGSGTLIALCASEIIMQENDSIGIVESEIESDSVIRKIEAKNTIYSADEIFFKCSKQPRERIAISDAMIHSKQPRDTKFNFDDCKKLGLNVRLATGEDLLYFN